MIFSPVARIIEIASDRRHLSVYRGFLVVKDSGTRSESGRVPIDDVAAVIASGHGISYSNNLLEALALRGAPFVLCGRNHDAIGVLLALQGNGQQAGRFDAQIGASAPTRKRLWAEIVRAKLRAQAAALDAFGAPTPPIGALVKAVRSGDSTNVEAQAARRYWPLLFGKAFRRDREAGGANALLNYGYTILRSAVGRSVVAAGLHPSLGLHHSNQGNPMRLVDDLMEPFRPLVDVRVKQLVDAGKHEIDSGAKRSLAQVLYLDRDTDDGLTPLIGCLHRLATSLAQVFLGERKSLALPGPDRPIAPLETPAARYGIGD